MTAEIQLDIADLDLTDNVVASGPFPACYSIFVASLMLENQIDNDGDIAGSDLTVGVACAAHDPEGGARRIANDRPSGCEAATTQDAWTAALIETRGYSVGLGGRSTRAQSDSGPVPDVEAVRDFISRVHSRAEGIDGVIPIAAYGESSGGAGLRPIVRHVRVGDVDGAVSAVIEISQLPHYNIYMPLAVMRPDLEPGKKGSEGDIRAVLGVVADFDDERAREYRDRLPMHPDYVIETSEGRFQTGVLLDPPLEPADAKPLARALARFTCSDTCGKDLSHVWRIPGTHNWPTKRKIALGRSSSPVRVELREGLEATDSTAVTALRNALKEQLGAVEAEDRRTKQDFGHDSTRQPGPEEVPRLMALLPNWLRAKIVRSPSAGEDRSSTVYNVIGCLRGAGLGVGEATSIILAHPGGIGARFVDRKDAAAAVRADVERCYQKVADAPRPAAGDRSDAVGEGGDTLSSALISFDDILSMSIPPREYALEPWLPLGTCTMIYAPPGVGKTLLALAIAHACGSGGSILGWSAPHPLPTLYVDGEMSLAAMQERSRALAAANGPSAGVTFLNRENCARSKVSFPNIGTADGRSALDGLIEKHGIKVVVVDSLATVSARADIDTNHEASWVEIQEWLQGWMARGVSFVLLHHTNKNGGQHGTSAKLRILETSIELKRPSGYRADQGCRFVVEFPKDRNFLGDAVKPFEASYAVEAGKAVWSRDGTKDEINRRIAEMLKSGMSIRATATALGVTKGVVEGVKNRMGL